LPGGRLTTTGRLEPNRERAAPETPEPSFRA
jgi:hypothetical protein